MVLAVLDGLRRVTAYILRRLRNRGRVAAFEEACHGRLPARGPRAADQGAPEKGTPSCSGGSVPPPTPASPWSDRPLLEVSAPLRRTSDASADSPTKLYAR